MTIVSLNVRNKITIKIKITYSLEDDPVHPRQSQTLGRSLIKCTISKVKAIILIEYIPSVIFNSVSSIMSFCQSVIMLFISLLNVIIDITYRPNSPWCIFSILDIIWNLNKIQFFKRCQTIIKQQHEFRFVNGLSFLQISLSFFFYIIHNIHRRTNIFNYTLFSLFFVCSLFLCSC